MKHEVIYYDNSIDKEGHAAELYSLTDVCLPSFRGCDLTNTCAVKILRWAGKIFINYTCSRQISKFL